MKRNNNFTYSLYDKLSILVMSNDIKRKLIPIYCISAFIFLLTFLFGPSPTAGDTETYFSAGSLIANGQIDSLRTPLYPLILNVFKWLFNIGITLKVTVIILQYFLFCISIFCFYRLTEYFIKSNYVVFFLVLIYACHPATLVWQKILITESLALSGIVFFLYFIIQFIGTKKLIYTFLINLFLFLLIILRPGFLFLIPIVLIFWLYFVIKWEKTGLIGMGWNVLIIILMIGYAATFQKQYGVFTMSTVSDVNQYMILRDAELLDTGNILNPEFKSTITDFIQIKKTDSEYFDEYVYLYSKYGYIPCHKFVEHSVRSNFPKYITFNINRFLNQSILSSVGFWSSFNQNKYNPYLRIICCPFIILYVFLIFYLYILFRKRPLLKFSVLIYSIALASLFVIIAGAPNSWGRLIVPTIPILLIMLGQCLDLIKWKIKI